MRFSTTTVSAIVAALATQTANASEEVSVTDLRIRKISDCSATDFSFPEPAERLPCGDSDYAFAFLPGSDGVEFSIMVYHDAGENNADLRGGDNVPTKCVLEGNGPADIVCTQQGNAVTFVIDGPASPRRSCQ